MFLKSTVAIVILFLHALYGGMAKRLRQKPAKLRSPVRIWVPPFFTYSKMTLFVVSTPIGNLQDLTFRAKEVLSFCDVILCEDTRQTKKLLHHYQIDAKLESFFQHNESQKEDEVICLLQKGKSIALVSDAGTPLLSDPGLLLVQRCHKEGIKVEPISGPSAILASLVISGFCPIPFQFLGFIPKKHLEQKQFLELALEYPGTSILFESIHRIYSTLEMLSKLAPERIIGIARELTKIHETFVSNTAKKLFEQKEKIPLKGEVVILIQGMDTSKMPIEYSDDELLKHLTQLQSAHSCSKKEAIELLCQALKIPKKKLYNLLLND